MFNEFWYIFLHLNQLKLNKKFTILDHDEYKLYMNGIIIISGTAGIILLSVYTFFDLTQKPKFIRKYKINPNTNEPPDLRSIFKVWILIYAK